MIEVFANFLISTDPDEIKCENHKSKDQSQSEETVCRECQTLKEKG